MGVDRRVVRVSAAFFDQLDELLGSERGSVGEPSATDFVVIELPAVVERFATDFESLPEMIEGTPAGRMLIAPGLLVRTFAVYGILVTDGSIELVGITIEA
jgi:hypothetical protein